MAWALSGERSLPGRVEGDFLLVEDDDQHFVYWKSEADGSLNRASLDPDDQMIESWYSGSGEFGHLRQSGRLADGRHFVGWDLPRGRGYRVQAGFPGYLFETVLAPTDSTIGNSLIRPQGEWFQVISNEWGAGKREIVVENFGFAETSRFPWPDEDSPSRLLESFSRDGGTEVLLSTLNESHPGVGLFRFDADGEGSLARPAGGPLPAAVEDGTLIPGDEKQGSALIAQSYDRRLFYWNGDPSLEMIELSDQAARFGDDCRAQAVRSRDGRDYVVWIEDDGESATQVLRSAVIDPATGVAMKAVHTPEHPATVSSIRAVPHDGGVDFAWVETMLNGPCTARGRATRISGSNWQEPETVLTRDDHGERLRLKGLRRNSQDELEALFHHGRFGSEEAGFGFSRMTLK